MAVAAARDCLQGFDRTSVGGVYFASTTAPYKEKQTAATIAAVLGLVPATATMDFSGSLRAGPTLSGPLWTRWARIGG